MKRDKPLGTFEMLSAKVDMHIGRFDAYDSRKWKAHQDLREKIRVTSLGDHHTLDEKIWALRFCHPSRPKCVVCQGDVKFKSPTEGYRRTCSVICGARNPATRAKTRNTLMSTYGGHHMTVDIVKDKVRRSDGTWPGSWGTEEHKQAILQKYGVENVSQHPSVLQKIVSSSPKTKIFTLTGKTVKLQGYEPQVLSYMLSAGVWLESELSFPVPTIRFSGGAYTPDFYLPGRNLVVEVKSHYTWYNERFHAKALSRAIAAKDAGYNVEVWIWDPKTKTPQITSI